MDRSACGHVCAAKHCVNKDNRSKISYFTFPTDDERCMRWITACGREDLLPKTAQQLHRGYRLCGAHFENKMFLNDLKNRLQPHAVPTIFWNEEDLETSEHNYSSRAVVVHKDSQPLPLWNEVCNVTDVDVVSTYQLCTLHFKESDYVKIARCLLLQEDVVPSVNVPNPLENVPENNAAVAGSDDCITANIKIEVEEPTEFSANSLIANIKQEVEEPMELSANCLIANIKKEVEEPTEFSANSLIANIKQEVEEPMELSATYLSNNIKKEVEEPTEFSTNCLIVNIKKEVQEMVEFSSDENSSAVRNQIKVESLNVENEIANSTEDTEHRELMPPSLEAALFQLTTARETIVNQTKTMKALQQKNRRYEQRIHSLSTFLRALKRRQRYRQNCHRDIKKIPKTKS